MFGPKLQSSAMHAENANLGANTIVDSCGHQIADAVSDRFGREVRFISSVAQFRGPAFDFKRGSKVSIIARTSAPSLVMFPNRFLNVIQCQIILYRSKYDQLAQKSM